MDGGFVIRGEGATPWSPCFDCGEPVSTQRISPPAHRRKPAAPLAEIGPVVRRVREQARDHREGGTERMILLERSLRAAHGFSQILRVLSLAWNIGMHFEHGAPIFGIGSV